MRIQIWKFAFSAAVAIVTLGVCRPALRGQDDSQRSVWDGVYTQEQAKSGQVSFNQLCAGCHGEDLTGADTAPPLAGSEFMSNWDGLTVGDLFERIRITMPMNNPQSLNRETTARLVAYILNFNRFPSGAEELSTRTEILKMIRLNAEPAKKK